MVTDRRTFKESRELKEHGNLAAEGKDVKVADVLAIEEDGGGRWLPEAIQSPQES
jgi:hypothetical protein